MADNQKEKLSIEQAKQRDQINFIVENASKSGKGITEIMVNLGKKSYYFRQVVSIPLKQDFISFIKSHFGVDIIKELSIINDLPEDTGALKKEVDRLRKLVTDLQAELLEIYKKK